MDKPALEVAGRSLLATVLAAVAGARTVVVGPPRDLPPDILQTREDPVGGGPAAALAAGLAALKPAGTDLVAVLAADLPGLTGQELADLAAALPPEGTGVLAVDGTGHRQYLLGVWRAAALLARVAEQPQWTSRRLGELLQPLVSAELPVRAESAADIDTPADLEQWRQRQSD